MSKPGQLRVLTSALPPVCPSRAPAFDFGERAAHDAPHTDTKPSSLMQGLVLFSFFARGFHQKQEGSVSTPNTIKGEAVSGLDLPGKLHL